jgi:ketosteroid isomerase-like protein
MTSDRRHPTDRERERANRPTVLAALGALEHRDAAAFADLLREDAVWLSPDGARADAAVRAREFVAEDRGRAWADPQAHGSHAVFRFAEIESGRDGAVVIEVRGARIVFVSEAP